ncbi:hypothetical protein SAMN05421503_2870 [Terribacillus aidingensis]|uniref:Peptidase M50 domain-containing protein n=1 Tax=Terribacillus aidingensis TaxID=586416 RepID=A0A285P338_9BACI|nr:site-2 protease family protein [Terribacillus aidingensis]SNZ16145.1 hypothetical protein SAMN05421503_2870 [Terribacillus aidingensis]
MLRRPLFGSILAVCLLAGACFLLPNLQADIYLMIQLGIAAFWAIALHELGHVIGGKLMGMDFGYFVVGPFHIGKGRKGIRVRENRSWGLVGGVALMLPAPSRTEERHRKDLAMMTISGPVMSLSLSLLTLAIWQLTEIDFFRTCSLFHGVILLATILPLPNGAFQTDGAAFYHILRKTKIGICKIQSAKLMGEMYGSKRPAQWSASMYKECRKKMENTAELKDIFVEVMFVFYIEADKEGIKPAIERLFKQFEIKPNKQLSVYYGPFLEWRMLADALSASVNEEKLQQYAAGVSSLSEGTYSRMQAMLACSKHKEALAYTKEAFKAYETVRGFGVLEREWTRMLANRIRKSAEQAVS